MILPDSSFSLLCEEVVELLKRELDAPRHDILVLLGTPADADRADQSKQRVNVFVYAVQPDPFGPPAAPGDVAMIRASLLITPFGAAEGPRTAGTNELVLLGEIVRALHESPVVEVDSPAGRRLSAAVTPVTVDLAELNHLWSLQRDVTFRPSVAYRLALAPIEPRVPRPGGPLVGEVTTEVRAGVPGPPAGDSPRIAFVTPSGQVPTVRLPAGTLRSLEVLVHGAAPGTVELAWETWQPEVGWQVPDGPPVSVACPEPAAGPVRVTVDLPAAGKPGQAVLRGRTAAGGQSNLLLVTLTGSRS